ncbi:phosphotransferase family protein [Xylocopilactobacillus apis]|uniref:Aminoglycoside phosphotransferase domain-containing protein n=1 Tax=Xylocopilactobacillus apis TaxID=2932183 RepID=A0AAU9D915_9LACO|nr:phosphotransferase [Xylocopilactobacillus apis]BDR57287.1 hypothetical protein KIMC2_18490 [Xylocopilactobacillus apis]
MIKAHLENLIEGGLMLVGHRSENQSFVGFSKVYNQSVFIKVFSPENLLKMKIEAEVNNQLNNRVIATFYEPIPILIMSDVKPVDITDLIDQDLSYNFGKILKEFHQTLKPSSEMSNLTNKISKIEQSFVSSKFREIFDKFLSMKSRINEDMSYTCVLHGDVGLRNYKIIDNEMTLIDFERAQIGIADYDFIKLFYQDFDSKKELIDSFLDGYGEKRTIFPETWMFLVFITAIGIMDYVEKVNDPTFRHIGIRMLNDVKTFLQIRN